MNSVGTSRTRIALIPARSGSKGLANKNLRVIAGRSLLARAIDTALEAAIFDRVFVSTDSSTYADEARMAGLEMPFLRPAHLANDHSLVADTIRHVLERFAASREIFDTLTLLEPSSPLRTAPLVREVTLIAEQEPWDAAFTVSPVPAAYHARKQFKLTPEGEARFVVNDASPNVNRQSLERTFIRNGLCYAVQVKAFLATHSIHGTKALAVAAKGPAISIDTQEDLDRATVELLRRESAPR